LLPPHQGSSVLHAPLRPQEYLVSREHRSHQQVRIPP
jgi:hypothetical protein